MSVYKLLLVFNLIMMDFMLRRYYYSTKSSFSVQCNNAIYYSMQLSLYDSYKQHLCLLTDHYAMYFLPHPKYEVYCTDLLDQYECIQSTFSIHHSLVDLCSSQLGLH